jgi:hypothetical protein
MTDSSLKKLLFVDFESFWDTKSGYGLKDMSVVEYVRDPRFKAFGLGICDATSDIKWIHGADISMWVTFIAKHIGWPNVVMVSHNVKFDAMILHEIYECVPGQFIDTLGMSKAVLGKTVKGHSLNDLAEHFQLPLKGFMKTDGIRDLTPEQEKELADYCLHDVELCREIYNRLAKDFPESEYASLHRTIDMFVQPKLQLNVPLLEKASTEEAERRANIFTEIGIAKDIFASNKKFPELLRSRGYDVPTKPSPKKKDSQGQPVQIPALALGDPEFIELGETDNEELKGLIEARIAAKSTLLETRSAKLAKIGKTGLWPFDVGYSGADQTHRFSGGSGAGGNPQNFTRGSALRTAVEAQPGFRLVVGDFSAVEARLVAYLSRDPGLVGLFDNHIDPYCDFASLYYGRKITKSDDYERRFGKESILGLGYGMGWRKFQKRVKIKLGKAISDEEAKKAVELYRTRYAKVPALWEKLNLMIDVLGGIVIPTEETWSLPTIFVKEAIILPSGLKIKFPNLRQEEGEHKRMEWVYDVWDKRRFEKRKLYGGKILENISQGLAGELCKTAMLEMGDNVTGLVHDEIHVVCRQGLEQVTAQKLKRVMTLAPSWLPDLKLEAEVGWGMNWGASK